MSLQEYYEDTFKSEGGKSASELIPEVVASSKALAMYAQESKDRFLLEKAWEGLKVIEMGSGRGGVGLQLARLGADVTLLDFSPSALEQAESVFSLEGLPVKTIVADASLPEVKLPQKYDLIVDSHLLHCITPDPNRFSYLQLIKDYLEPDGIFVAETMVHRKKLFIPEGFMFDETNTLWQMFGDWKPVRRILDSLDLEAELKAAGFEIIYFYYYGQYVFIPHKSWMDIPNEILPASVRFVLKKKD